VPYYRQAVLQQSKLEKLDRLTNKDRSASRRLLLWIFTGQE